MRTSAELLLDTSSAVARVVRAHPQHQLAREAVLGRPVGLSGHALAETYSVLTRLPGGDRLHPADAHRVIARAFPESVALPPEIALDAAGILSRAGIAGGAVYDGLVGLAARAAGVKLFSLDRRAASTYALLGVELYEI